MAESWDYDEAKRSGVDDQYQPNRLSLHCNGRPRASNTVGIKE